MRQELNNRERAYHSDVSLNIGHGRQRTRVLYCGSQVSVKSCECGRMARLATGGTPPQLPPVRTVSANNQGAGTVGIGQLLNCLKGGCLKKLDQLR
jgi:hypothetical protein